MPLAGNEFMLSHFFKDVSSIETTKSMTSCETKHFGISWQLRIKRNDNCLGVLFHCRPTNQDGPWEIKGDCKFEVLSSKGISKTLHKRYVFASTRSSGIGVEALLPWDVFENTYLVDNAFQLLAYVKIKKATGVKKKKLRDFSEPHRNHTDGVLIVEGEKFHISKGFLAKLSPFFRQLFFGNNADANKKENELHDVNAKDFQNFLEEIHGKDVIDEDTVKGILKLARRFDWESCIEKCVEFLIEESDKPYKEKLAIGTEYQLKELINHCIMRLNTNEAIRAAMPNNINDLDPTTAKILLKKSVSMS